jgi:hypothetical protein
LHGKLNNFLGILLLYKDKFSGTCGRAANWIYLGDTKGLGKDSQDKIPNRSIKAIYGYPLSKDFRKVLGGP